MDGQTLGQARVRKGFNPSENEYVDSIKELAAAFIDLCERLKDENSRTERNRCLSIAQTEIETAAMYAVKGATSERVGISPAEANAE